MPTIKFSLNDEYYSKLETAADDHSGLYSIQAVRRVQVGDFKDKTFSLPDLYGDAWTLERGMAGVFGKNFYNYISEHTELGIRAQGYDKKTRREIYIYEKEE